MKAAHNTIALAIRNLISILQDEELTESRKWTVAGTGEHTMQAAGLFCKLNDRCVYNGLAGHTRSVNPRKGI
jgi:hypothetical protein